MIWQIKIIKLMLNSSHVKEKRQLIVHSFSHYSFTVFCKLRTQYDNIINTQFDSKLINNSIDICPIILCNLIPALSKWKIYTCCLSFCGHFLVNST